MTETAALIMATAALITAAVTFSGFLISKDLKTTEFRQAWINDQRADLAVLVAEAQAIERHPTDQDQVAISLRAFDEAAARIKLRENPKKEEWKRPIATIAELRSKLGSRTDVPASVSSSIGAIFLDAQNLLKVEWDRVRAGEESYRTARVVAVWAGFAAAMVILIMLSAIGYGKGFIVIGKFT